MPVPLAIQLLTTLGPAAAKAIGASKASKTLQQDIGQIESQYDELAKSMPKYGVGSAFNEYLSMSKQDPAADMKRQIAAEQEATNVGALKAGGARALLGGLGAAQRQAAQQRMKIEADSFADQQDALKNYATIQQQVDGANVRLDRDMAESKFKAINAANAYNQGLKADRQQALFDGLGALAGSATDIYGGIKDGGGFNFDIKNLFGGGKDAKQRALDARNFANTVTDQQMSNLQESIPGFYRKNGGMMTKGAFSHEKNPIDIMQDGAKVGEMTGGEAILNPEQQKKVAKQSPYFRQLMREFAMRNRK